MYQKECAEALDEYFAYGAVVRAAPGDSDDLLIARALLAAKRKIEERDRQLAEQRPKVEFADSITASPDSVPIAALAHDLEQYGIRMGRNRLFTWLRDNGYYVHRHGRRTDVRTATRQEVLTQPLAGFAEPAPVGGLRAHVGGR